MLGTEFLWYVRRQYNNRSFVSVSVVGNHSFTHIAGSLTTFGLKADGSLWAWGYNAHGEIGNNTTTSYSSPVSVVGNHSFIQISAAYVESAYGLKVDGSVWAWGSNSNGQLGNLTTTSYSSPISVVGNHSFIQISAGSDGATGFVAGLKADGLVGNGVLMILANSAISQQ